MTRLSFRSFQSTLPRRERHISTTSKYPFGYFNPRSREGSDIPPHFHLIHCSISIHAPAKGATTNTSHTNGTTRHISIHAPAKGATDHQTVSQTKPIISIHAPAKGATWQAVRSRRVSHFNPRSREGSDERPAQLWARLRHFNPRSREGSDRIAEPGTYDVASISIHAPAKGATASVAHTHRRRDDFNPRSREGSDHTTVLDS